MSEPFIKLIKSKDTDWLVDNHPNAFMLLTLIALRARREEGHPDGLLPGQCHIGDHNACGLTRQQYRTALALLTGIATIKIIETCRNRKKSTTGTTTRGTLVELTSSKVYDINLSIDNHPSNHRPTTDQPPTNHELRKIRNKEINTPTPLLDSKIKFREHVLLTQTEFDSLLAKHGQDLLDKMLDVLDSFKGSTGKQYKSDFYTMKDGGWVVEKVRKSSHKVSTLYSNIKVDRRTRNKDGTPMKNPVEGLF